MTVSATNYTSSLITSIYNKLITIVGTTYTHATLGAKTIKYVSPYPPDVTAYKSKLPIIILERANRRPPEQFELGGRRKYTDIFYIDIIAGGYDDENSNSAMKNYLVDKIIFGFDLKRYNLTNQTTKIVEGEYQSTCHEIHRIPSERSSIYERHHSRIAISTWATIKID